MSVHFWTKQSYFSTFISLCPKIDTQTFFYSFAIIYFISIPLHCIEAIGVQDYALHTGKDG